MIIIIGAGLSGLLVAYRLKQVGLPIKILEARSRVGGRIHTVSAQEETPVEMGATWFNHQHQCLLQLLDELGLNYYEQFMKGTAYFQPTMKEPAQPVTLPEQAASYRVEGGTSQLIHKLQSFLKEEEVLLDHPVTKVAIGTEILVTAKDTVFKATKLILAIPPQLVASKITFEPELPERFKKVAENTHTWMEDSVKISLIYKSPFWREKGLSGVLFSQVGPLTEFYDHCDKTGEKYALCGFLHPNDQNLSAETRQQKILDQLIETFGEEAKAYIDYQECVWSGEKYTSLPPEMPLYAHQNNGHPLLQQSMYNDRIFLASTEVSSIFGGYMEGAVAIASKVASSIINTHH